MHGGSDVYCGGSTISPNDNEGIQKSYDQVGLVMRQTLVLSCALPASDHQVCLMRHA